MVNQKHFETPYNDLLVIVEYCIVAVGGLLVVTAFFRLGWFGTWHGRATPSAVLLYILIKVTRSLS